MDGNLTGLHPMYPVLCVPRVFLNITQQRIVDNFKFLNLGEIQHIEMIPKVSKTGQEYQTVIIEMVWNFTETACQARHKLLSGGNFKIIYDKNWFWKVCMFMPPNQAPAPNSHHVKRTSVAPILDLGNEYTLANHNYHQPNHRQPNHHQPNHRQPNHRQSNHRVMSEYEYAPIHRNDDIEYDHSERKQYDNRSGGCKKDGVNKPQQAKSTRQTNIKHNVKIHPEKNIVTPIHTTQLLPPQSLKVVPIVNDSQEKFENTSETEPPKGECAVTYVDEWYDQDSSQLEGVVVNYTNTLPPAPRKKRTSRAKHFVVEPCNKIDI